MSARATSNLKMFTEGTLAIMRFNAQFSMQSVLSSQRAQLVSAESALAETATALLSQVVLVQGAGKHFGRI